MSHFIGLCFGEFWEQNLEQYDESLPVEEYVTCTKKEAIETAKAEHENTYKQALKYKDNKYLKNCLDLGPTINDEQAWEQVLDWGYKIDDEGNLLSTYNPNSRWDWYAIGGRWSPYLPLKLDDEEREYTNMATVDEIDWDEYFKVNKSPFCFVTEEGEWVEKGEMGWWGCVNNEKDTIDWNETFKNYVMSLDPNTEVWAVDFHI